MTVELRSLMLCCLLAVVVAASSHSLETVSVTLITCVRYFNNFVTCLTKLATSSAFELTLNYRMSYIIILYIIYHRSYLVVRYDSEYVPTRMYSSSHYFLYSSQRHQS